MLPARKAIKMGVSYYDMLLPVRAPGDGLPGMLCGPGPEEDVVGGSRGVAAAPPGGTAVRVTRIGGLPCAPIFAPGLPAARRRGR